MIVGARLYTKLQFYRQIKKSSVSFQHTEKPVCSSIEWNFICRLSDRILQQRYKKFELDWGSLRREERGC